LLRNQSPTVVGVSPPVVARRHVAPPVVHRRLSSVPAHRLSSVSSPHHRRLHPISSAHHGLLHSVSSAHHGLLLHSAVPSTAVAPVAAHLVPHYLLRLSPVAVHALQLKGYQDSSCALALVKQIDVF
jgi:hypothetical protein